MSHLILLSGGVESATLLHHAHRHEPTFPVFLDYGQRAAPWERRAAQAQCDALRLPLKCLDLASLGRDFRAGQSKQFHVPLPHRNLIALSVALSYATQIGAERLSLALNREDTLAYPSASPAFLASFRALAGTLSGVEITTPLIELDKAEVVRLGRSLGVDYARTYSCLLGHAQHCGRCPQCLKRQAAFAEAGVSEPEDLYRQRC